MILEKISIEGNFCHPVNPHNTPLCPQVQWELDGYAHIWGDVDQCLTHVWESKSGTWRQNQCGLHCWRLFGKTMHETYILWTRESQAGAILSPAQDTPWQSENSPTVKSVWNHPPEIQAERRMVIGETESITHVSGVKKCRNLTKESWKSPRTCAEWKDSALHLCQIKELHTEDCFWTICMNSGSLLA